MTDQSRSNKGGENATKLTDQGRHRNHDKSVGLEQPLSKLMDMIEGEKPADQKSTNAHTSDLSGAGRTLSLREKLDLPAERRRDGHGASLLHPKEMRRTKGHDAMAQLAATIAEGDAATARDKGAAARSQRDTRAPMSADGRTPLSSTDASRPGVAALGDAGGRRSLEQLKPMPFDSRDLSAVPFGLRADKQATTPADDPGPNPQQQELERPTGDARREVAADAAERNRLREQEPTDGRDRRRANRASHDPRDGGKADAVQPTAQELLRSLRGDAPDVLADRNMRVSGPGFEGFASGRTDLLDKQFERLERAVLPADGTSLYGNKDLTIVIAAGTSALGGPESNQVLSDARAATVQQEFIKRGFIGEFRILSKGEGERVRADRSDNPYERIVGVALEPGPAQAGVATGALPDVSPPRRIEREEPGLLEGIAKGGVEYVGLGLVAKEIVGHVAEGSLGMILHVAKFQLEALTQLGDAGTWRSDTYIEAFASTYARLTSNDDRSNLVRDIQNSPYEHLDREQIEGMKDVRVSDGIAFVRFKQAIEASARHDALRAVIRLGKDEVQAFSREHPRLEERREIIHRHLREYAIRP